MKKRYLIICFVLAAVTLLSFTLPVNRYFEISRNIEIFSTLFKEVNTFYVDDINPNKLMRTGIDVMLNSLDPYTNFTSEDEVEDYKTLHTGEYSGIGAMTTEIGGRTLVAMVYKGYPAYEKGLKIGDEIIKANGQSILRLSAEEIKQLMSGQEGSLVRLSVKRVGVEKPVELEFKLQTIKRSNVPYFGMVAPETGYIQLTEFTRDAAREVKNAVVKLKEQGATSIILDLRGNPGGLLDESVNICNIFLPKGKKVVSMKGKVMENNRVYETINAPVDTEIPLAILISRGSASASEIVAGTIQDYDRGIIIGEKSFGKGLVQGPMRLSYGSQIKITIAKYYTPTGRCIQVLDYTHRKEDGSVGSVPDSVKKEFITTHGRKVYDGGGIDPDTKIKVQEMPAIVHTLLVNGYIFDYASLYASRRAAIPAARAYGLTDQEYQEFVSWMKGKEYNYKSAVEIQLTRLMDEAKKERAYADLKPQFDQLTQRLSDARKNDLLVFKDQIKTILEKEIAARYYLEEGTVESGFKNDPELKEAIAALHNTVLYKKVLHLP